MQLIAVILVSLLVAPSLSQYGQAPQSQSSQHSPTSGSAYQSNGNDQLRFHPENSQYFTNEVLPSAPQPTNNNNAPSYQDLLYLQQQEAQQQAIIDAQKRLETEKIVKDIEFIQKQQDQLQKQIHEQEIKNELMLNHPQPTGSYAPSPSAYNAPSFDDGLYKPSQQTPATPFDDGLYHGEGSNAPNDRKSNHHSRPQSSPTSSYGGAPNSFPNPQPNELYPEYQPSAPTKPTYGPISPQQPSYGPPSQPPPPPQQQPSYRPPPQQPQQPSYAPPPQQPQKPSYGPPSQQPQQPSYGPPPQQQGPDYWWLGPNSPFSPNQLGNCNHLDCSPRPSKPSPSQGKPPPPQSGYGSNPPRPPPSHHGGPPPPNGGPPHHPPPPSKPTPPEPVIIDQNPYLSNAINNKPYKPSPPPQQPPPPPNYQQQPPPPPPTYPQQPSPSPTYPTQPSSPYEPTYTQEQYNPTFSTQPTQQFEQPTPSQPSPSNGYGPQTGSGTPGVSFPDYQPPPMPQPQIPRVPCGQKGYTCVAKHLCIDGKVNTRGVGIIQYRISMNSCRSDIEVCCQEDEEPTQPPSNFGGYGVAPGGSSSPGLSYPEFAPPSPPASGSYQPYQPSSNYQQSTLPRASLPDFVPPLATATLPILKQTQPSTGGYGK